MKLFRKALPVCKECAEKERIALEELLRTKKCSSCGKITLEKKPSN